LTLRIYDKVDKSMAKVRKIRQTVHLECVFVRMNVGEVFFDETRRAHVCASEGVANFVLAAKYVCMHACMYVCMRASSFGQQ
jgi:hypothetical protein